jgi:hypothetical protein
MECPDRPLWTAPIPTEPNSFPARPVSDRGSKGHRVAEIAAMTSLGERWMEQFLER